MNGRFSAATIARHAGGHRLDQREGKLLAVRRQGENVEQADIAGRIAQKARQEQAIGHAEPAGLSDDALALGALPDDDEPAADP